MGKISYNFAISASSMHGCAGVCIFRALNIAYCIRIRAFLMNQEMKISNEDEKYCKCIHADSRVCLLIDQCQYH